MQSASKKKKKGVSSALLQWLSGSCDQGALAVLGCSDCWHKFDQGARPEMELSAGEAIEHYDLRVKF
jgi:hypothetical protein